MAELFTNPAKTLQESYKATTEMVEDVAASSDIKQATEQVKTEQAAEGNFANADMFKVNSMAAQMAAQRGDTRSADKFQKQANDYRKDAIAIQLNEFKLQQDKLEALEQTVNMVDSPASAIEATMKSDLPQQQKMALISQIKATGNDPEQFKLFKDKLQSNVMTAKDRITAEQRTLKMKQDHEDKKLQREIQLEQVRSTAHLRELGLQLQREKLDWQKEVKDVELNLKGAKTEIDIDKNVEREKSKVDKDPLLKPEAKARRKAELDAAGQRQKDILKGNKGGKETPAADIPQGHVDYLLKNDTPENRASFDKKYGKGAANEFIERSKQEKRK
jgi:hypothetical protein